MVKLILLLLLSIPVLSISQPGSLDLSFNPDDRGYGNGVYGGYISVVNIDPPFVFYGSVNSISIQKDEKLIIGGDFIEVNKLRRRGIARLLSDGMVDPDFDPGSVFESNLSVFSVNTTAIQSDRKIIAGGYFENSHNGFSVNGIARLNGNGSLDTTFNTGTGFNGIVDIVVIQEDGKILAGGSFTRFNGINVNRLARLLPDGSLDESFSIYDGFDGPVVAICIQPDNKILIGGNFTTFNGTTAKNMIRLNPDGSPDDSFNTGSGFDQTVNSISIQDDGKILAGGAFKNYDGNIYKGIIRLDQDGSPDTSFDIGAGFSGSVRSVVIQNDQKILAIGAFRSFNDTDVEHILRLNEDGSIDSSFGLDATYRLQLKSMAVNNDGKIYIGGLFHLPDWPVRNGIARLEKNGKTDLSFNPLTGIDGRVFASAIQPDGKILFGGQFTSANGITRYNIVRMLEDGIVDHSFKIEKGVHSDQDDFHNKILYSSVNTISLQSDDKIIIGGYFFNVDDLFIISLARLYPDGTLDPSFNKENLISGRVYSTCVQPDGKILVGGNIRYNGIEKRSYIFRLYPDGTLDLSFNPVAALASYGIDKAIVKKIIVQPDEKIIIGGYFHDADGKEINNIIRLNPDGSHDAGFYAGSGFDRAILDMYLQDDGKIVCGGRFSTYNGEPAQHIARLNHDGSMDHSFNAELSSIGNTYTTVESIIGEQNGKIIIGGYFNYVNGHPANMIALLNSDGSPDTAFDTGLGFDMGVLTICRQADGRIIAGGDFYSFNGTGRNGIARLFGDDSSEVIEIKQDVPIMYYPNPVSDKLFIDLDRFYPVIDITLIDIFGRKLMQKKFYDVMDIQLEINYPPGLYFVRLLYEDGTGTTLRIIKD